MIESSNEKKLLSAHKFLCYPILDLGYVIVNIRTEEILDLYAFDLYDKYRNYKKCFFCCLNALQDP